MPEYKNQHYVPQFFFRGWTDNDRVPVFDIENQEEYPPTHTSNLCAEDYFYGAPELERDMGPLEDIHASIIHKLRQAKDIRVLNQEEIHHLCVFVLYTRNRTKRSKVGADFMVNWLAEEYIRMNVEAGVADEELLETFQDYEIVDHGMHKYSMLHALAGPDLILDLEVVLLKNQTDKEFVFSDHPVVHDNRRYKRELDRFLFGLQNRGLQIYCPLADDLQMILYDQACYSIDYDNVEARTVTTESERTIEGMNDFQMINAHEQVFYRTEGQKDDMIECLERVVDDRPEEPMNFERTEDHEFPTENEIIGAGDHVFEHTIHMPFMRERPNVPHQIERIPGLRDQVREYIEELKVEHEEDVED